jgi:FixJ family two-component response regulator
MALPPMIDIIDDDDAVRDSTHQVLESYGYEARAHASAEDFLSCEGDKAACLLVDHHMPGMTGLELLEHLHAKGDRTPALVMTGRSDPTILSRAERLGVKVVHKPLGPDEIVGWIKENLRGTH